MAPEQVRGEAADARTDLFALGVLLYELATGQRPFRGATLADLTSSILRDAPVPIGALSKESRPAWFASSNGVSKRTGDAGYQTAGRCGATWTG